MERHLTPIADELRALSLSLDARAKTDRIFCRVELQQTAETLNTIARRTAPLERFYAELTAEAEEKELLCFQPQASVRN